MLKKFAALSLSLLICMSLLPGQAGAMDAPENEQPVQAEDAEDRNASNDADVGIMPCIYVPLEPPPSGYGGGIGAGDSNGAGGKWGSGTGGSFGSFLWP